MSEQPVKAESAEPFACKCEACLREGPHEPDCGVHGKPPAACSCGRADQSKGAG